jgi:PHD/YefM family antitoxin component YafN of YafNO toxin-antitoxin module
MFQFNKYRICAGLVLLFGLAACETAPLPIDVTPVAAIIAQPADPAPLNLLPIHFIVATSDNVNSIVQDFAKEQNNKKPVFVIITMHDYENMSLNTTEMERYILSQKAIIEYFRKVTESEASIDQPK